MSSTLVYAVKTILCEFLCIVGLTAFSESPCCTDQEKSTFPLWVVVNFGEILLKGGKILTTLAEYSRVIYQSIGNFMLITIA